MHRCPMNSPSPTTNLVAFVFVGLAPVFRRCHLNKVTTPAMLQYGLHVIDPEDLSRFNRMHPGFGP